LGPLCSNCFVLFWPWPINRDRLLESGREAALRKGSFALLLVLASFAGGAAVNGPGLQWAKDQLFSTVLSNSTIGQVDEADTEPGNETDAEPDGDALKRPAAPPPPLKFPPIARSPKAESASTSELELDPIASESAKPSGVTPEAETQAAQSPTETPPAVAAPRVPSIANGRDAESPLDLPERLNATAEEAEVEKDADHPDAPPRLLQPLDIPDPSPVPGANSHQGDFPDAPDSAPAEAILPGSAVLQPPKRDSNLLLANGLDNDPFRPEAHANANPAGESDGDWERIQGRLKELGVSRYWVEGHTEGPVLFRCLVPMVGGRVVSQHFEAEGDDAIQAAEVVLGRIALWKTTTAETRD
jgi:hypothetical protein